MICCALSREITSRNIKNQMNVQITEVSSKNYTFCFINVALNLNLIMLKNFQLFIINLDSYLYTRFMKKIVFKPIVFHNWSNFCKLSNLCYILKEYQKSKILKIVQRYLYKKLNFLIWCITNIKIKTSNIFTKCVQL